MCPAYFWTPCRHYSQCIGWCPKCADEFLAKLHEQPGLTFEVRMDSAAPTAALEILKRSSPALVKAIARAAREAGC